MNAGLQVQAKVATKPPFTPARTGLLQRKCACGGTPGPSGECEECREKRLQRKTQNSELGSRNAFSVPPIVHEVLRSPGQPLDAETRAFMEPRFGHDFGRVSLHSVMPQRSGGGLAIGQADDFYEREADQIASDIIENTMTEDRPTENPDFSQVRVHTDTKATESAQAFNALAYTIGSDVVFGAGQYHPERKAGKHLLAHELAHVIQQQSCLGIQRQEIPSELRSSIDASKMTDEQLHQRYDLIITALGWFTSSSSETVLLEEQAGPIGAELTRRSLAAGRTFGPEGIERMRNYFVQNAKKAKPRNCIDTMNDGLQLLFQDKKQKLGDSVDKTMGALQRANRAGEAKVIEFEDRKGRISRSGSAYPFKVHESVWDTLLQMNAGDLGWSVFGMGPADMSHSVTLTLDNRDPARPVIYWSDQWGSKGGWKKYDRAGLDAAVAEVTQIIWNEKDDKHKPDTKVTLWRLRQDLRDIPESKAK